MNWPTSQDYNESVQDAGNSFTDPDLKRGSVVVNALGLPVPRSGTFADVYQFRDGSGKMWALKCFTRKVAGLRERYAKIDEHLVRARLPFAVEFRFLPEGILVRGEWFPLLKMEWVEGFGLNDFVAANAGQPQYLHALVQMWVRLSARLREADIAHGDLQHGNVLLVPGATPQKLGLKLVDYDGMWVPALAEHHSGEVGHPNYQHPLRLKERLYNGDVDRFPHLVAAAALRATMIGGKPLWDRFDNGDNLLFKAVDLRDPASSSLFKVLWELNDPVLCALVGHLALSATEPLHETPWLDHLLLEKGGPQLPLEHFGQGCLLLRETQPCTDEGARTLALLAEYFSGFEVPDEEAPGLAVQDEDDPGEARAQCLQAHDRSLHTGGNGRRPTKVVQSGLVAFGAVTVAMVAVVCWVLLRYSPAKPSSSGTTASTASKTTTEGRITGTPSPNRLPPEPPSQSSRSAR